MKRRKFLQKTAAIAALGAIGKTTDAFANVPETVTVPKRKLGKTGFPVFPVVYGGIISMHDGQDASDQYVSWAIDRGINYFDVYQLHAITTQEDLDQAFGPGGVIPQYCESRYNTQILKKGCQALLPPKVIL